MESAIYRQLESRVSGQPSSADFPEPRLWTIPNLATNWKKLALTFRTYDPPFSPTGSEHFKPEGACNFVYNAESLLHAALAKKAFGRDCSSQQRVLLLKAVAVQKK